MIAPAAVWLLLGLGSVATLVWVGVVRLLGVRRDQPVPGSVLVLVGSAALAGLASVVVHDLHGPDQLAVRLWALGAFVLFAAALTLYPDGRPPRDLGMAAPLVVVAAGLVSVAYPRPYAVSGLAGFVAYLLLLAIVWWRVEHTPIDERRPLVWLALGLFPGPVLVMAAGFVAVSVTAPVAVGAWLVGLLCLAVGLVAPELRDVREIVVVVAVHGAAALLVLTVYATTLAGIEASNDGPVNLSPGAYGALAALCAVGYAPVVRLLRGTVDLLLFGDRKDPLDAAFRAGERLDDDPVLALRSLRESLLIPYAALLAGDGAPVAVTGTAPASVERIPLSTPDLGLGHLEVGLRPGELALSRRDRDVVSVLVPALAQLVRARALRIELQASRAHLVQAIEEERRRLRRDLHDGIGPRLTGLAYTADAARNRLNGDGDDVSALLVELREEAGEAIAEVRRLVEGLRPPSLDQVGLEQALLQHARHLHGREGTPLRVTVQASGLPELGAAAEVTAYRIVVEALTNAARHSPAEHVGVRLWVDDEALHLEVCDDGGPSDPWLPGVGLTSMRERADALGGRLEVTTTTAGSTISAGLPLP